MFIFIRHYDWLAKKKFIKIYITKATTHTHIYINKNQWLEVIAKEGNKAFIHECLDKDQIDTEVKNKNKTQKISTVKGGIFFNQ